jgi:ribonuclease-3
MRCRARCSYKMARPAFVTIYSVKDLNSDNRKISDLEQVLSYEFNDRDLLRRALTHRSWAHEQVAPGREDEARRLHNESFEFIGDSVLGLIVAEHLFRSHPDVTEGELSRMKHRIVSASTLATAAKRLGIGEFLRVGRGEEKTGGRKKAALLADAFEAVLGAIYFDGGIKAACEFVSSALGRELSRATPAAAAAADYKTLLQELLQACHRPGPKYVVVETEGPPHRRTFCVEVTWDSGSVRAKGRTIKTAETSAAKNALALINGENTGC